MRKKRDPNPNHTRLPNGQKVKIVSQDGATALVQRLGGGERKGTVAVCSADKLKSA
jgi:hypothetical protein